MHVAKIAAQPLESSTLSALLPTVDQTWLLRACLLEGEESLEAWQTWVQLIQDPRQFFIGDGRGMKRLLPLLYRSLRRNGASVDPTLMSYLRSSYVYEELRSHTYRRLCHDALAGLAALAASGAPIIVLKGAALAATVYDDWALRHCHDIDILLSKADFPEASRVLGSAGFTAVRMKGPREADAVTFVHDAGLPVQLHGRLFGLLYYEAPLTEMRARSERALVAGVFTRVLTPEDNLVNICGHASYSSSRASLIWVCDAWYTMKRFPDLDWDIVLRAAQDSHLVLVLSVMLDYLADSLKAPIPQSTLARFRALAEQSDTLSREAAMFGARVGPPGTLMRLIRQQNTWSRKAAFLKWLLLPSPMYLSSIEQMRHRWLLPVYYLYRPLRAFGRYVHPSLPAFLRRPVRKMTPSG